MYSKLNTFFQAAPRQRSGVKEESPLNQVQKYIDAQIEYNKILAERALKGHTDELLEIAVSIFLNLDEMPPIKKLPSGIQEFRKAYVNNILADLKVYQELKELLNTETNTDSLYLNIYFTYKNWLTSARDIKPHSIKLLLSFLYEGNELRKKTQEIISHINTKSSKSPIMCEINGLLEILKILESEVRPSCLRFIEDVNINQKNGFLSITFTEEALRKKVNKKALQFLQENPSDQEFASLMEQSKEASDSAFVMQKSSDLREGFLQLFKKMETKYKIDDQINMYLREKAAKKEDSALSPVLEEKHQLDTDNSGAVPFPIVSPQPETPLSTKYNKEFRQSMQMSSNTPLSNLETKSSLPEPAAPKDVAAFEPSQPSSETKGLEEEREEEDKSMAISFGDLETFDFSVPETINSTINNPENQNSPQPTFSDADIAELETQTSSEDETTNSDEQTEKELPGSVVNHYSLYPKTKNNKSTKEPQHPPKTKHNVLKLNKDQQQTLLEVFDLLPYDSINLRALVNLTQALGGTMKTSGSNRCRIEMKNIYAHLLVPEEALSKACDKATVTMHGGGHRAKRSQNNDNAKAPQYLISQFKAAFIRAGYTPINLGLNVDSEPGVKIK